MAGSGAEQERGKAHESMMRLTRLLLTLNRPNRSAADVGRTGLSPKSPMTFWVWSSQDSTYSCPTSSVLAAGTSCPFRNVEARGSFCNVYGQFPQFESVLATKVVTLISLRTKDPVNTLTRLRPHMTV